MNNLEDKKIFLNDNITSEKTNSVDILGKVSEDFVDERYISFNKTNRIRAEKYVEKYYNEMKENIEVFGYFVYDEFETIYLYAGRFIPDILNEKFDLHDEDELTAVEEMIEGEGCLGVVIKRSMLGDRENIISILKNH